MYVTTKGFEYLALAKTGITLQFTKVEFGQGYLDDSDSVMALGALKDKLGELPIIGKSAKDNQTIITCQFTNATQAGGLLPPFWWSEVGIYAQLVGADGTVLHPEILYGYAYAEDKEHADLIQGVLEEFKFNIVCKTAGASSVTVSLSSMAYVERAEFEEKTAHYKPIYIQKSDPQDPNEFVWLKTQNLREVGSSGGGTDPDEPIDPDDPIVPDDPSDEDTVEITTTEEQTDVALLTEDNETLYVDNITTDATKASEDIYFLKILEE